jgi:putative ABC transport system permease protein
MYLKQGTSMTVQDFGYDISFSASQGSWHLPDEQLLPLYDQLKTADGVYKSAYLNFVNCSTTMQKSEFTERFLDYYSEIAGAPSDSMPYYFSIYFINDDIYQRYLEALKLSPVDYGVAQGMLPAVAKVAGYDSDEERILSFDVFNKRAVTLEEMAGANPEEWRAFPQKIAFTISEIMPEGYTPLQFTGLAAFAPYSEMALLGAPEEAFNGLSMTFSSLDPMKSAAEMETMIKAAGITSGYRLYNTAEAAAQNRNILMIINVFTYGFVILISLIAIANVFNTISTGIHLRRREFAMLRSVGMGAQSFNRMMNFECVFYGLKALLYGLPASVAITYLIYKATLKGIDVSFHLPWGSIAIAIISVFFVVFITMMYATSQIKKANVIDSLRIEV